MEFINVPGHAKQLTSVTSQIYRRGIDNKLNERVILEGL